MGRTILSFVRKQPDLTMFTQASILATLVLSTTSLSLESTKAASSLINCGCQCSSITFLDSAGEEQGNCKTVDGTGAQWCYVITFQVLVKIWCLQRDSPTSPGLMRLVLLLLKEVLFAQLWNMSMPQWLLPLLTMSMLLWLLPLLIMSIFQLQNMSMSLLLSPLHPMFILLDNTTQRFLKDSMLQSLRLLVWQLQLNRM